MPRPAHRRHPTPTYLPPRPEADTLVYAGMQMEILASTLPAFPVHARVLLEIAPHPERILPVATVLVNGIPDLLLVEQRAANRLCILIDPPHRGWIEVDLVRFGRLCREAQRRAGTELPAFTTVAPDLCHPPVSPARLEQNPSP